MASKNEVENRIVCQSGRVVSLRGGRGGLVGFFL